MKLKRLVSFGSAVLVSLSSLLIINIGHAFAATVTWDGEGADNNFSTAANWSGDTIPVDGDTVAFTDWSGDPDPNSNSISLVNDLAISFAGISGNGPGIDPQTNSLPYYFIDTLTVDDAGVLGVTDLRVFVNDLNAEGDVTIGENIGADSVTAVGDVTVVAGATAIYALSGPSITIKSGTELTTSASDIGETFTLDVDEIVIENGATLYINGDSSTEANITSNITFGGGAGNVPAIVLQVGKGGPGSDPSTGGVTISGDVTLLADAEISLVNNVSRVEGTLTSNGFTLTINIDEDSILMGNGTVGIILNDGTVSPGSSPGCLSSGSLSGGGAYDVEIGGTTACTGYDQLSVTGTVDLTSGNLNTSLYNGYKPKVGEQYTIFVNDGTDTITGIFTGLAEGATFEVDGYVFKITYRGGTGNDVVLSVQSVPGAPDTGLNLGLNNPFLATALIVGAAGAIGLLARKQTKFSIRR